MKFLVIIFLFSGFIANVQRTSGFYDDSPFSRFLIEDSIAGVNINQERLQVLKDTLPFFLPDSVEWDGKMVTDLQLVYYYFDSLRVLKKIFLRNGRVGYYSFYFEGPCLIMAIDLSSSSTVIMKHYYSAEECKYSFSKIENRKAMYPQKMVFFRALKMGKMLQEKFNEFLEK